MKFAFTPQQNERIEAILTIPEEKRSIVHGTVYDLDGNIIKDAVVRLFEIIEGKPSPKSHTFTDADGEFIFGPLFSGKDYMVKVYVEGVKIRELKVRQRKKKSSSS